MSYDAPLGERLGTLSLSANYTYQSQFSTAQTNLSRVNFLPSYSYVNAEADLTNIGGRPLDIALFVDNLTNATYATGLADFYNGSTTGTVSYTFAPPRACTAFASALQVRKLGPRWRGLQGEFRPKDIGRRDRLGGGSLWRDAEAR